MWVILIELLRRINAINLVKQSKSFKYEQKINKIKGKWRVVCCLSSWKLPEALSFSFSKTASAKLFDIFFIKSLDKCGPDLLSCTTFCLSSQKRKSSSMEEWLSWFLNMPTSQLPVPAPPAIIWASIEHISREIFFRKQIKIGWW